MSSIVGIVLSGGASQRMGSPKALLAFPDGTALLARQAQLLADAGCARVVAVVGAHAEEIQSSCRDLDVVWAVNERWELGQFSSLQAGLSAVGEISDGAVVLPVDVVGVSPATVEAIIETALRNDHLRAVIPEYDGHGGHPIFLSPTLCHHLLTRDPTDATSRLDVILRGIGEKIFLPVSDAHTVANINTAQDWDTFCAYPSRETNA